MQYLPGRYYAAITSDEYLSSDSYKLTVNATPYTALNSETEENGSFETADRVSFDSSISGNLSSALDLDFFVLRRLTPDQ